MIRTKIAGNLYAVCICDYLFLKCAFQFYGADCVTPCASGLTVVCASNLRLADAPVSSEIELCDRITPSVCAVNSMTFNCKRLCSLSYIRRTSYQQEALRRELSKFGAAQPLVARHGLLWNHCFMRKVVETGKLPHNGGYFRQRKMRMVGQAEILLTV